MVDSLSLVNFQDLEYQIHCGEPICVNCQRIWDTSPECVFSLITSWIRKALKEIHPVPSSGMGPSSPTLGYAALHEHALSTHLPSSPSPPLSFLPRHLDLSSCLAVGAAGITTACGLLIKLINHACSFMQHPYCSPSTVLREGGD